MKKTIIILVVLAIVLAGAFFAYRYFSQNQTVELPAQTTETEQPQQAEPEQTPAQAEDGDKAPDLTLTDLEGNTLQLSELLGKPTILNFWATWCSPCQAEMPLLQTAYEQFGSEIGFVMVNLTDGRRDTPEGVAAFVEENGFTFPVYCDAAYAAQALYGIRGIPMTVLLDSEGNILQTHFGPLDQKTLDSYIELLAEDAVKTFLNIG